MQLINFSLFVESWRSRFLKGRQQWHSHYRGLLLGYRSGVTTIKLYHQVSQLQVGLHLIRAVFARGGQCWGYAISVGNRYTEYGHLYQRWMPGQFSNNWFAVDQNRYRRQQFTTTSGSALTYLKSHFSIFNRCHQRLDLVAVRARVIYRLYGQPLKVNVRVRREIQTTTAMSQYRIRARSRTLMIQSPYLKKRHQSKTHQRSLLLTNTRYAVKYQHAVKRRQKLNQNQLIKLAYRNFLTTEVNQRLITKYLIHWSAAANLTHYGLITVRGPTVVESFFSFLSHRGAAAGYNPVVLLLGRSTWFNQQCAHLRYVTDHVLSYHAPLVYPPYIKQILLINLLRMALFYRQTSIVEQQTKHQAEFTRQYYNRRTFFRFGPSAAQINFNPRGMKPVRVRVRRRSKVRPFRPPAYLQEIFTPYLKHLKEQARLRRLAQRRRYLTSLFLKKHPRLTLKKLQNLGKRDLRLTLPVYTRFNSVYDRPTMGDYLRRLNHARIYIRPTEMNLRFEVRPHRTTGKHRLIRRQNRLRLYRVPARYQSTSIDRLLTEARLTGWTSDQQMLTYLQQLNLLDPRPSTVVDRVLTTRRRQWNLIQQLVDRQLLTVARQSKPQIKTLLADGTHRPSTGDHYPMGYTSVNRRYWRPAPALFDGRRARHHLSYDRAMFVLTVGRRSTEYRPSPVRQPLTNNYGQLQLQLFPAVVIGGPLTNKLQSLASEVANTQLPFVYLYASSVPPYVASYGVIWNNSRHSARGLASLIDIIYRYTSFSTCLQMVYRRLEL